MSISSDDIEDAQAAIDQIAEAFEELSSICKGLDEDDQADVFNPEVLGAISAFLGCGNGYEAAIPSPRFMNSEKLISFLQDRSEPEDDDDDDDPWTGGECRMNF